jgi:ribosomal protein L12E/L44/L45/RPP1/RPP2
MTPETFLNLLESGLGGFDAEEEVANLKANALALAAAAAAPKQLPAPSGAPDTAAADTGDENVN